MKPATRVIEKTSTLGGESIAMSIDPTAFAHIMSVLTDLYSDPELAVIREYSTNAYDAHIESGVTRPIEVTLPSQFSLFLKIRDFGEGLNRDDIAEIYSQYGASTKRGSNDVVGMLGLGCKSALTYTDQFTVTGWKDGIRTQIAVSRDADGAGSMTIIDQRESDEDSGVEISVPAKTYHKFESKAKDFFKFWNPDTVLINGEKPEPVSEGIWLNDNLLLTKDNRVEKAVVVMGNVAYPLPRDSEYNFNYGSYSSQYKLVARVGIGDVNFVPSREALAMTTDTKTTLANLSETVANELERVLTERIQRASSKRKAIKRLFEARELLNGMTNIKWNGHAIPLKFEGKFVIVASKRQRYSRSKGWELHNEVSSNNNYLWVTGYEVLTFTPHKRKKMDKWLDNVDPNHEIEAVIFTNELPNYASWIDKTKVYNWETDIKPIQIDGTTKGVTGRLTGSYDYLDKNGRTIGVPADTITTTDLYWITPMTRAEINSRYNRRWRYDDGEYDSEGVKYRELFFGEFPNATVVLLPANRVEKFKRDFPMAINYFDALRERAEAWVASVSSADKLTFALREYEGGYGSNDYKNLFAIEADEVNDPRLKRLIKSYARDISHVTANAKKWAKIIKFDAGDVIGECPYVKYPLLSHIDLTRAGESARVHAQIYVNAVHAAGKDKQ